MRRDYTERDCTEERLYYTYTGKRLHKKKTTQGRSIKRGTTQERLHKRDYNRQKGDYTRKRLHREELYMKGYITQKRNYTEKRLYGEGLYYTKGELYGKKIIQRGTTHGETTQRRECTIQKEDYTGRDYIGKDYIGKDHTGRDYIEKCKL